MNSRLFFSILSFSILILSTNMGYAKNLAIQKQIFTLKINNKTVRDVFSEIENKSDYIFFYSSNTFDANRKITIDVKNESINNIMNEIVKNTNSTYLINGKKIFIKEKPSRAIQQKPRSTKSRNKLLEHKLIGHVYDADNNDPLIGVSVTIKDVKGGTITDLNGEYQINVNSESEVIFSYIGYKTKRLQVGDLGVLNINMESDNQVLNEVVVVGAGTQKKVSVTGAITSVKGLELKSPSASLTNNFAGQLAGVISVTSSGEPGSASAFYIRGVGTFGGRATPLILLDDIEISANDLNNIPAESIETFSILKDASATAIYGARGANGVMLITTKSGYENTKAQIHVTVENSYLKPTKKLQFVDGARYMELYNEADLARTPSATPRYSATAIENTRNHTNPYLYPDVNWYGLLFKNSNMDQRVNINIQGGSSRVTYYMSLQSNHNTGLLRIPSNGPFKNNINQWRYVFQDNISYKISPTTNIDLRMNTQIGEDKGPGSYATTLYYDTYAVSPVEFPATFPTQEGDKHIRFGNAFQSGSTLCTNPYSDMLSSYAQDNTSTINTSLHLLQDFGFITKGLNISALVNWKNYFTTSYGESMTPYFYRVQDGSWDPTGTITGATTYSLAQLQLGQDYINQDSTPSRYGDNTFYLDGRINYNRSFGPHTVSGLLMYMMREYRNSVLPSRNQGWSGRFTYDYQNKYLAEFNFGYNGTERLASGHRFEFFPAMSLGWVVSSEDFWKPISKYIGYFKLRGSYGLVGNDETGEDENGVQHFLYINAVSTNVGRGAWFGSEHTAYWGGAVQAYAVENAHWERVKKMDIGIDLNLFNEVDVVFDYFHDKRDRILMQRATWPQVLGYGYVYTSSKDWPLTPWSNIGKVDNKGFELSINWKKQIRKNFSFEFRGNFSYNKNKYVNLDEPNYPYSWQLQKGKPLSATYGYIAEGLFKDNDEITRSASQTNFGSTVMPGDIKYRDINGDGVINSEDRAMISPYGSTPRLQYGLGLNVTYNKFDCGVFFTGSAKRTIMIMNDMAPFGAVMGNGNKNVMKFIADNHWTVDNPDPNAQYPRLGLNSTYTGNNTVSSSFWTRNGNFIRWKTLEIGYTFSHCRIYFSGDNLAVWSPFKLWDPELSWSSYPLQRTFNIGAQLKF